MRNCFALCFLAFLNPMKIFCYIDGFNLYYGALKNTQYKWLDIVKMCQLLYPQYQVEKVKYFTARVSARPSDPDQPIRQQTYFRALGTRPEAEIIEGRFLTKPVRMLVAGTVPQQYANVIKTEEKGSDVNLAVHLLHDAYKKAYEGAVVISNDSDLLEAILIVRDELGFPIALANPQKNPSFHLQRAGVPIKKIRPGVLAASQFSTPLTDANGTFHKPQGW